MFLLGGSSADSLFYLLAPFHDYSTVDALLYCELNFQLCLSAAARKIASHFLCRPPSTTVDLFSLFDQFRFVSWSITSAVGALNNQYKVRKLRHWLDMGCFILPQETHVGPHNVRPHVGQFAHTHTHIVIYYVDAVTTDNGGTSGGLCFLVPTNSAAVVQRSPVTFVLGGIAYLDISFLGLELRVWNVYLSAYATTRSKQIKEWAKVVRSCGDSDRIHTVLGDLNVDPAGDKDHAQWEDLLAITNSLAGCQVALDGAAYGGVAGGANSTIDHAFA